jgi:hypothetical protein
MIVLLLATSVGFAQVWENPCKARPELKTGLDAGLVKWAGGMEGPRFVEAMSSSHLAPTGTAPPVSDPEGIDEPFAVRDAWTCMYGAPRLLDGKPETAWAEGAPGPGIGEVVLLGGRSEGPLEIWAGYGKSAKLHAANPRPRQIEVLVLARGPMVPVDPGTPYQDNRVIARRVVELADLNGYQPLPLPELPAGTADADRAFIALRILSVYPGTKWEDTCISEVRRRPAG